MDESHTRIDGISTEKWHIQASWTSNDKRPPKYKWVFKLSKDGNDKLVGYKTRSTIKGFDKKKGIYFDDIFSPVVRMTSIITILSLTASLDIEI